MPIFNLVCKVCQTKIEELLFSNESPSEVCMNCGAINTKEKDFDYSSDKKEKSHIKIKQDNLQ